MAGLAPWVPEELAADEQGEQPNRHQQGQQHPQEEELQEPVRVRKQLGDHAHPTIVPKPPCGMGPGRPGLKGRWLRPDASGTEFPTETGSPEMSDTKQVGEEADA